MRQGTESSQAATISREHWLTPLELTLLGAIWGAAFLFMRVAVGAFGPLALVEIRLAVGALMLLPFLCKARARFPPGVWPKLAGIGLLNSALPFLLFSWATLHAPAGVGAITNALTVLFTTLIAALFFGERITTRAGLALVAGFVGVVVLASGKMAGVPVGWAALAGTGGSLLYGIAINLTRRHLTDLPSAAAAAATLGTSALILLPFALWQWPSGVVTLQAWGAALALGVVCTGIAFLLYYRLIARIGASRASTVTYLIPVIAVFAALLALLALAMFDVFTFQVPTAWQTGLAKRTARIPGGRTTGAALLGAASALIVGPCVAAPLAGALLYISQTGDVWLGGMALFALAWGMGAPLLLVAASSAALLPRAGNWMNHVKYFFGVLLLASAWWLLMPVLASWLQMLGWAALAALAAVVLRAFDPLPTQARAGRLFAKTAGLLLALASVVLVVGVASGGRDPLQPLAHLAVGTDRSTTTITTAVTFTRIRSTTELDAVLVQAARPVMLDFYADWCVSCKEMERFTFPHPGVADKLRQMVVLQADVTANNAEDRALLSRFRLFGPPGIVFFAPGGRLLDERVIGFQNAARFDAVLTRVLAQQ